MTDYHYHSSYTHLPGRSHLRSVQNGDHNIPRAVTGFGRRSFSIAGQEQRCVRQCITIYKQQLELYIINHCFWRENINIDYKKWNIPGKNPESWKKGQQIPKFRNCYICSELQSLIRCIVRTCAFHLQASFEDWAALPSLSFLLTFLTTWPSLRYTVLDCDFISFCFAFILLLLFLFCIRRKIWSRFEKPVTSFNCVSVWLAQYLSFFCQLILWITFLYLVTCLCVYLSTGPMYKAS